jgi:hypothetical protein
MKKWIGYILLLYILFCAIVPCTVFDDCEEELFTEQTTNENAGEDCSNCSPFSICTSCHNAAPAVQLLTIQLPLFYSSHSYSEFYCSSKSEYHNRHFEPPRTA